MRLKITGILMAVVAFSLFAACQKSDGATDTNGQVSSQYKGEICGAVQEAFVTEINASQDLEEVAQKLTELKEYNEVSMLTMPVEEGFLNGFDNEIKGFNKGVMFSPVIGTIPFVGYVFEADDPNELLSQLNSQANMNWNLCTTADEKLGVIVDKYVLFVMAPLSFEE